LFYQIEILSLQHVEKGTIRSISALVPNVVVAIKDEIQTWGTIPEKCIQFLCDINQIGTQLASDHVADYIELFFDWGCYTLEGQYLEIYFYYRVDLAYKF